MLSSPSEGSVLMTQSTYTRPTIDTEEVRLATTMTGGVSLAVWMGGVAREIDLVLQASRARRHAGLTDGTDGRGSLSAAEEGNRARYGQLLELLDILVDVDVLSGTSAGGINAVLLGYARARNLDLGELRNLWLEAGAMLDLLRTPTDGDVGSLLYGDRRLLRDLDSTLRGLGENKPAPPRPASTTLYVTTTLLTGETSRITDAVGTLVQDTYHRGLFTFTEADLVQPGIEGALAVAARSTASFPGAFEPAYVPYDKGAAKDGDIPLRPPMQKYADITRSHWVADGGLLDNQPLDVLLQRIFDRPARRPVRRVLLFVVPTTGPAPDLTKAAPGADPAQPFGLLDGLLHDLAAATSQSISVDLRAIVEHNDRTSARHDLRTQLASIANRHRLLTPGLLDDFREREGERQARKLANALMRVLSTWAPQQTAVDAGIPADWLDCLRTGSNAEEICRVAARNKLKASWPPAVDDHAMPSAAALPSTGTQFAGYGRFAFDNAKSIVLKLCQLAYEACASKDERAKIGQCVEEVHRAAGRPLRTPLTQLAGDVCTRAAATVDDTGAHPSLAATAEELALRWLRAHQVEPHAWSTLAKTLEARVPIFCSLAARADLARDLAAVVHYCRLDEPDVTAEAIARRLFDLAVVEQAMLPVGAGPYQPVELVQLSADTRSLLTPSRSTAGRKLTGLQMHHFGAFYKKSWRANDWMWGRVDAAGWLVHVLLDPRRLCVVADRSGASDKIGWLLEQLGRFEPVALRRPDAPVTNIPTEQDVRAELAFLADRTIERPKSLPTTSMWLATAWQTTIAEEELPLLAEAVLGGEGQPADRSPGRTSGWAKKLREPGADCAALLDACPVADETFATDMGSPLMVHTVAKAAASTSAALASVAQLPKPVKPAVSFLRTITLAGYRLAEATRAKTRLLLLAGLLLLAAGAVAAAQTEAVLGLGGLAAMVAGAYAVTVAAWQLSSRLLAALVATTLVLAVAALTFPVVRRGLFGTSNTDNGYVGRHVYWLGSVWWHPLIVVAAVVLLITLGAFSRRAGRPAS
jgi:patatin-related protein